MNKHNELYTVYVTVLIILSDVLIVYRFNSTFEWGSTMISKNPANFYDVLYYR